jgi:FkbM family methyltransferase
MSAMAWRRKSPANWPPFADRSGRFEPRATADDIFHCFRLILGRLPNAEEWRGHAAQVGEELDGVVASYVNSLEFGNRGLQRTDHMRDLVLAALPGFQIYLAADDAAVGRHVRDDNYERDVTAAVRRLLRPGMGVVDLGANIGYFSMLSAALVGPAGRVFAVEPNPRNARMIEASRRANGFANVLVMQIAAGVQAGLLVLHRSHSNGTTSPLTDDLNAMFGAETVPCLPVDAVLPPDQRIDFIKVDVEGAEYLALQGCERTIARWRPIIISEVSPGLMPGISGIDAPGYLTWLLRHGYTVSVIQPDGACGPASDAENVMKQYRSRGVDHVDIVAQPV